MDVQEMERRFKAAVAELGLDPRQAAALGEQLVATEKAAQGVAFKSDALAPPEEITLNGVTYRVKESAPPAAMEAKADMPPMGGMGEPPMEAEMEEVEEGVPSGNFVGDMTPDEFFARMAEVLAPVLKMQEMVKTFGDMTSELKGMVGSTTSKDDSRSRELATLKEQQAALAARITEIEGSQPATVLPEEVQAALKSAGPQNPVNPDAPEVPNDPSRPWAGLGAQTFPELYRGYSENGWVK